MNELLAADAARLLEVARRSLEHGLARGCAAVPDVAAESAPLRAPGASFVTLHGPEGELRGCVGMLEPVRPLVTDVAENAFGAGFRDVRFPAPRSDELHAFHIHISVLAPLERLAVRSEAELLAALRPGVDGLVLRYREQRGTFLPDVWASLPEPSAWLHALAQKTGLPAGFWSEEIEVQRYTTRSIQEPSLQRAGSQVRMASDVGAESRCREAATAATER